MSKLRSTLFDYYHWTAADTEVLGPQALVYTSRLSAYTSAAALEIGN